MIHGRLAERSHLTVQQSPHAPIAIGGPFINNRPHQRQQPDIIGLAIRRSRARGALHLLDQVGAGDAECVRDRFHREPSSGRQGACDKSFFDFASANASWRISFSSVFLPNKRSSSRIWRLSSRTSAAATTWSSARTASWPPSVISRLHLNTRLG